MTAQSVRLGKDSSVWLDEDFLKEAILENILAVGGMAYDSDVMDNAAEIAEQFTSVAVGLGLSPDGD